MTDLTLHDLAEQVLGAAPTGTKTEWGKRLAKLAGDNGDAIAAEVDRKLHATLGAYVAGIKSAQARQAQHERALERGITHEGRPLTSTISVRTETGTQTMLWMEASPTQFVEAVFREQSVIDGRSNSNKLRRKVAEMCQDDDGLMDLPTLADVCAELGIDPDELELNVLAS